MTRVELCVQDLEGARIAREVGADRVELCVDISVGGLTPSFELVEAASRLGFPGGIAVLVRPRAGDFVHDSREIGVIEGTMRDYSERLGRASRLAFVVGVLDERGLIHRDAIRSFREAAGEHDLVFHRAFDRLEDRYEGLEILRGLGVDRVLTTGGHESEADPTELRRLIEAAGDDITILASGGLRSGNVARIVSLSGAREVHMRAPAGPDRTDPREAAAIMSALTPPDW
ncbi:MAG: copper homeostasis protein CutC [Schaalia hyovaginalis]|uniref:copper homeostasis protein CutC n=1 Tax=Schaalia hyovaginalis TaxID=29316 RepID=UPI002A90A7F1|nr:copper homeostasis protein CutC [Schaalia hyovaginalis]MDY6213480.1 copper homeostasis protein CutC [Schaalia hyovaginalis]